MQMESSEAACPGFRTRWPWEATVVCRTVRGPGLLARLPVPELQELTGLAALVAVFLGFPWTVFDPTEGMLGIAKCLREEIIALGHGVSLVRVDDRGRRRPPPWVPREHGARPGGGPCCSRILLPRIYGRIRRSPVNQRFYNCYVQAITPREERVSPRAVRKSHVSGFQFHAPPFKPETENFHLPRPPGQFPPSPVLRSVLR